MSGQLSRPRRSAPLDEAAAPSPRPETSFSEVFGRALLGEACSVIGLGADPQPLPIGDWCGEADEVDRAMLSHCVGSTLDVGCGPGRLSAHLSQSGHLVLGIDVVREAVLQTRDRGALAVVRNVFTSLPGEGRWQTVLLADGNVGIGGDPVALLRRARQVLDPTGRVVVELGRPGTGLRSVWAAVTCGDMRSKPFRWAVVGVEAAGGLAAAAQLDVADVHEQCGRWWAVLERPC